MGLRARVNTLLLSLLFLGDRDMADEYRSFTGEIKNLQKKNDYVTEIEVWALNNLTNRNNWRYTDMAGNKDQFAGTPILIAYLNDGKTIGAGHEFDMEYDAEGNEAPTFTAATSERIIGCFSEDTNDIRIETTEDGVEWIVAKGYIWKWYAKEAAEKIERDSRMGRPMSISIETLVTQSREEDGVEVEEKYIVLGTTVLGDGVMPAVADAHIKALQEIESEMRELKLRAASYIVNEDSEPDEEDKEEDEFEAEDDDDEEPKNEPQENSTERKVNALDIFRKKQLAELAPRFEGYTILSAGQDENGIHVCLLSKAGETAVYTMAALEDLVDPKKIVNVDAQVVFSVNDWTQAVELESVTDDLTAKVVSANNELDSTKTALATANETISTMTEKEMKRRVSAAKAKAQSTLEAFNANREQKVDASILNKINECIDNGDFSECENADGEWVGEEQVCDQVLAACAKEVMEMDKVSSAMKNSQFVWDGIQRDQKVGSGDVESLLAQFDIK